MSIELASGEPKASTRQAQGPRGVETCRYLLALEIDAVTWTMDLWLRFASQ